MLVGDFGIYLEAVGFILLFLSKGFLFEKPPPESLTLESTTGPSKFKIFQGNHPRLLGIGSIVGITFILSGLIFQLSYISKVVI